MSAFCLTPGRTSRAICAMHLSWSSPALTVGASSRCMNGCKRALPAFAISGMCPEADLAPLTAAATVFTYVSLYEGFGLPVAQALAAGVPIVTSNVSALPEVAGDAALLVDPRSREEVRSALERLLLSPSLRAQLADRGRARAREFTWEACALKSWEFFRRVVA